MISYREIRHAHLYCGLGGGAKGFNQGRARVGSLAARFRCIGGIDVDPAAVRDFERLSGVRGTVLDLFDREQYVAFHGCEPPRDWRAATADDITRAYGGEHPHILFLSPPCKGLSGLLSNKKSQTPKYEALNRLTLRGLWLVLEAYRGDPVELIVLENVPRIAQRGRHLLDQIIALLRSYGYAVAETTHDCGELGGLAQTRKRFLLVARHMERVPSFLYQPEKKPLRSVGELLGRMPRPGDPLGGPMHKVPRLQFKTWVRLAFIEAGKDWRSLNRLTVEDGFLRDYGIVPEGPMFNDALGVTRYDETSGTITSRGLPFNGRFAVADPLTGYSQAAHCNLFKVIPWGGQALTITGAGHPAGSALSVADPRSIQESFSKYHVVPYGAPSRTVIARSTTGQAAFAVADPTPGWGGEKPSFLRGHYGVTAWDEPSKTVTGSGKFDNSYGSVADPRPFTLPAPTEQMVPYIRALDDTWHRPFTTLELAVLQALIDPEEYLELEGLSDSAWRERIGNAVPPRAASAIAGVMGEVLLLTWSGETFSMSQAPIWVKPMTAALMVAQGEEV